MKDPTYRSMMRQELSMFCAALPVFWAQQTGVWGKATGAAIILWDIAGLFWQATISLPFTFAMQAFARKAYPVAIKTLSSQEAKPFGIELATKVTARLLALEVKARSSSWPLGMAYAHRDYCGHAIQWIDGKICVGHADDGAIWPKRILMSFETPDDFKAWLSQQSDYSLGGLMPDTALTDYQRAGNQRITRDRLQIFADGG